MSSGIKKEPTPTPATIGTVTQVEGQAALIYLVETVLLYKPGPSADTSLIYEGQTQLLIFLIFQPKT